MRWRDVLRCNTSPDPYHLLIPRAYTQRTHHPQQIHPDPTSLICSLAAGGAGARIYAGRSLHCTEVSAVVVGEAHLEPYRLLRGSLLGHCRRKPCQDTCKWEDTEKHRVICGQMLWICVGKGAMEIV